MTNKDQLTIIYASIVSFQFHPGVKQRMTPNECISLAYKYASKLEEFQQWLGSAQQSPSEAPSTETSAPPAESKTPTVLTWPKTKPT